MNIYKVRNINEALYQLASAILQQPEIDSRNGACKELHPCIVEFTHPWECDITLSSRKDSRAAKIAETAWVLSGRDEIKDILPWLPRAKDYSDDGETWRGAYGPRLRNWGAGKNGFPHGTDQIAEVYEILRYNPDSRRAVINLYDPAQDFMTNSKDIPCNNWLHFMIRDGKLDLEVVTRSNDLIWGFSGINYYEWTVLQAAMASWLKIPMGRYIHYTSSMHVYAQHYERARNIMREGFLHNPNIAYGYEGTDLTKFTYGKDPEDLYDQLYFAYGQRDYTNGDKLPDDSWVKLFQEVYHGTTR